MAPPSPDYNPVPRNLGYLPRQFALDNQSIVSEPTANTGQQQLQQQPISSSEGDDEDTASEHSQASVLSEQ